ATSLRVLRCEPLYFFFEFLGAALFGVALMSSITIDIGVEFPARSSFFTGSVILSAVFTSMATCQICVSVSWPLKLGIPLMRIPFSTFQYDSHGSSPVTPLHWNNCGGSGNIPCDIADLRSPGRP